MTNPVHKDSSIEATDEAWAKLQQTLAREPVNPAWAAWKQPANDLTGSGAAIVEDQGQRGHGPTVTETAAKQQQQVVRRPRMNRRRKWAIAAAAVAGFAVILSTPVGNTAMAAILNQFRMQQVTIVDESDLRDLFYQVNEGGTVSEAVNAFGTFTTASGEISGELPKDKMMETLGYKALSGEMFNSIDSVQILNSREATLTLNVEAVNQALKRLGAEQLLPESVDGKAITLHMPEIATYDLSTDDQHWASLSQMNTPTVIVDPSIGVAEALNAVLNFPLLPESWKTNLQQSRILSGELPMPLVKGSLAEEITVGGTPVILQQYDYNQGTQFHAVWVRHGQMFEFSGGNVYPVKAEFIAKLQELISA